MKKLLFIAILTLVGCSTDEPESERPTANCDCGIIRQTTYLPNGLIVLKIKKNCTDELIEVETNQPHQINEQYCF